MRKILLIVAGTVALSITAQAQSAVHEYYKCSVSDGSTIADVLAVSNEWRVLSDAAGFDDYLAELLIPIYSEDVAAGTFYWEGTAPSRARLAEASDWYASDEAAGIRMAFSEVSTCESASLFQIIELGTVTAD